MIPYLNLENSPHLTINEPKYQRWPKPREAKEPGQLRRPRTNLKTKGKTKPTSRIVLFVAMTPPVFVCLFMDFMAVAIPL